MKTSYKAISVLLAVMMFLALMAGCSGSSEAPADKGKDTTLTVGTVNSQYYIFAGGSNEKDFYGCRLVYDYIFEVGKDGKITSRILDKWEWVGETTLKMVLKDDIYFSDGSKMTGEDIIFSVQIFVDNQSPSMQFFKLIDFNKSYVDDDGLTVYFEYAQPYGAYLSSFITPVMSKAYVTAHPQDDSVWWNSPMGSGPYEVTNVVMNTSVEYAPREDYWDDTASYEPSKIIVKYYSDITTMFADFQNGVLDLVLNISDPQVKQINNGQVKGATAVIQSNSDCLMLCFNEATVTDPAIREAVAHAVDWNAIGEVAFGSLQAEATSHYATSLEGYYKAHAPYSYDPNLAKEILSKAGYSAGDITLSFVGTEIANHGVVGEAIQAYLDAVGIKLEVNVFDLNTMLARFMEGNGDLSLQSLAGSGGNPAHEPDRAMSPMSETNFPIMRITDPVFNQLLQKGLNTTDISGREAIYREIDDYLYENFQALPICETQEAYAFNSRIKSANLTSVNDCFLQWVSFN